MAWNTPLTFVDNDPLTAAQLNQMLNENMNESAVAKASTPTSYFVSDSANSISERQPYHTFIGGTVTTSSTSFVALGGPSLSVTHGTEMFILWSARVWTSGISGVGSCVADVNDTGASVDDALRHPGDSTDLYRGMGFKHVTGLTPGTSTVQLKYLCSTGTGSFAQRRLLVWPF